MTDSPNAMKKKIAIGIIGSGTMGRTYSECLLHLKNEAQLIAVSGGKRAQQLAADYGVDYESSIESMAERNDIDAVIIATPDYVHLDHVKMAAGHNKHILVEKPLAPTVEECAEIIRVCETANVKLMTVKNQRFKSIHQKAHELIQTGQIGKVHQIRHWNLIPLHHLLLNVQKTPFYFNPGSGGLYLSMLVHNFDLICWLAGSAPVSVYARAGSYCNHNIPNLSLMAQISFASGINAQVWFSGEMPGHNFPNSQFHTQVVGDMGMMDFDGHSHLDLATYDGWKRVMEVPEIDYNNPLDLSRLQAFISLLQAFFDSINNGTKPSVTGDDGALAVKLCLAALESSLTNQAVRLPG